jgi:predicted nucleic acid-binding protein
MRVLVDTSAFLAVMDVKEQNHLTAKQVWERLIGEDAFLICTNYVLVETITLIQRRLGMSFAKAFQENVTPFLLVEWVDESLHLAGVAALLTANRRQLSLVDCISFETARRLGLGTVFAFDQHFVEQGFTCLS